jgi:hypothetical protein
MVSDRLNAEVEASNRIRKFGSIRAKSIGMIWDYSTVAVGTVTLNMCLNEQ